MIDQSFRHMSNFIGGQTSGSNLVMTLYMNMIYRWYETLA